MLGQHVAAGDLGVLLDDPGQLRGGGEEAEALGDAGAQVLHAADLVGGDLLAAAGDDSVELLLQSQLHAGVSGDEGERKDDGVADGVHAGGDVVHDGGLDVLHSQLCGFLELPI